MIQAPDQPAPDAEPIPPRNVWLKRLTRIGLFTVLGVMLVHIGWTHEARRRLDAAIARYRQAGGPVTVEDFEAECKLPDEKNATFWLDQALASVKDTTVAGDDVYEFVDGKDDISADLQAVAELLDANEQALDAMRRAFRCDQACWRGALPGFIVRAGGDRRVLARVMQLSARYDFVMGDQQAAFTTICDIARFGEAVAAQPLYISALIGWTIEMQAVTEVERLLPTLCIDDENGGVPRADITEFISWLLNDSIPRESWIRAALGERALALTCDSDLSVWPRLEGGPAFMVHEPLLILDSIRAAEFASQAARSGQIHQAGTPHEKASEDQTSRVLEILAHPLTMVPSGDQLNLSLEVALQRLLAIRRMMAIGLALSMYETDKGQAAPDLAALVGEYLREVPSDPFALDGGLIRMKAEGGQLLLYSIGPNGEDDGGSERAKLGGWRENDIVFYLNGRPPLR